jgi:hypothetical protein
MLHVVPNKNYSHYSSNSFFDKDPFVPVCYCASLLLLGQPARRPGAAWQKQQHPSPRRIAWGRDAAA